MSGKMRKELLMALRSFFAIISGPRGAMNEISESAEIVLYSDSDGVLSEHSTISEAMQALHSFLREAKLGDRIPQVLRNENGAWQRVHSLADLDPLRRN